MTLLDTALFAHGRGIFDRDLQAASLDHALWFHRPFRADEWLLYAEDSPSASGARGFTRGSLFSRDGTPGRLGRPGRADPAARPLTTAESSAQLPNKLISYSHRHAPPVVASR